MRTSYLILTLLLSVLLATSCWIGDTDDVEVLYETTLIEELCQTPEISDFCEMIYRTSPLSATNPYPRVAWLLQFSTRKFITAGNNNGACVDDVETVFAPTNEAIAAWMSTKPQWNTIYDIPRDTIDKIVNHHIYRGKKLFLQIDNPTCNEEQIVFGNTNPYQMMTGTWIFAQNSQGEVRPLSLQTFAFPSTAIYSPDINSTDGAVYVIDRVLGPFL